MHQVLGFSESSKWVVKGVKLVIKNQLAAAAYQLGNTSSRTITEVKQR